MRRRPRLVVALAALALVGSACGGGDGGTEASKGSWVGSAPATSPSGPGSTPTTGGGAPAAGPGSELLAATVPVIGGGDVDLASYRGRPTLLWFWAPW